MVLSEMGVCDTHVTSSYMQRVPDLHSFPHPSPHHSLIAQLHSTPHSCIFQTACVSHSVPFRIPASICRFHILKFLSSVHSLRFLDNLTCVQYRNISLSHNPKLYFSFRPSSGLQSVYLAAYH